MGKHSEKKSLETGTEEFRRVQLVFDRAIDLHDNERSNFLRETAQSDPALAEMVERLLRHHDPDDSYLDPLCPGVEETLIEHSIGVGSMIGAYRLTNKIESGGTGTVWAGERADGLFDQRVAVKLLSWGLVSSNLRQRFDAERRMLAQLEHPFVARLIDGGTTNDGIPFLVMEHINGVPIDVFCRTNHLILRDRLELFCKVCDAVEYAHRHLIVHCDLTPNNILVAADGKPKLVDFGLSRLLAEVVDLDAPDSAGQSRAHTPEYASPEQIRGDCLTTATDVFSLGAILSGLLACFDANQEISPHYKTLPRDLCCIVDRARQPEPQHRYLSVEHLSTDLQCFLNGAPVSAHPQGFYYRFRKLVGRHAVAAGLVAALAVSIAVGTVGMTIALMRAKENAKAAKQAGAEATATASFLTDVLVSVDPWNSEFKGPDYTVRELIDDASTRLPTELAEFPNVQSEVLGTLGSTYRSLGMLSEAEAMFREALETEQDRSKPDWVRISIAQRNLGELLIDASRLEEADQMLTAALEYFRNHINANPNERASTMEVFGRLESARGQFQDAEKILREVIVIRKKHSPEVELANTLHLLGRTLLERADYAAAIDPLREALALRQRILGDNHALAANTMSMLGYALAETNQVDEARDLLNEAVEIQRIQLGDNQLGLAESLNLLALFHSRRGECERADVLYREILEIYQNFLPPDHADLAATLNNLGQNLRAQGRYEEAVPVIQQSLDILIKNHGTQHPTVATVMANLGSSYWRMDRLEDAFGWISKSYETRRSLFGEDHAHTLEGLVELSALHADLGHFEDAERLARQGLATSLEKYPTAIKRAIRYEVVLGKSIMQQKKFEESEAILAKAHERAVESLEPTHPIRLHTVRYLAKLYDAWGDREQAAHWHSIYERQQK